MNAEIETKAKPDPAMGEILTSIKQIITEEQAVQRAPEQDADAPPKTEAGTDDVLELTDLVEDEDDEPLPASKVLGIAPQPRPAAGRPGDEVRSRPAVVAQLRGLREAATIAKEMGNEGGGKVSPLVQEAIVPLAEEWVRKNLPSLTEKSISEAVRPIVQEWMDHHLPEMVERVVREEVSRMVEQAGKD